MKKNDVAAIVWPAYTGDKRATAKGDVLSGEIINQLTLFDPQ